MEITASSFKLRANAPEDRKAISYQKNFLSKKKSKKNQIEFEARDGTGSVLVPIERPQGFSWIDSQRGSQPIYGK